MQRYGRKLAHTACTYIRVVRHLCTSFRLARQITLLSRELPPQWSASVSVILVWTIRKRSVEQFSLSVRVWDTRAGGVAQLSPLPYQLPHGGYNISCCQRIEALVRRFIVTVNVNAFCTIPLQAAPCSTSVNSVNSAVPTPSCRKVI